MRCWRDKSAKLISSVLVSVRARSAADVEMRQSSRNGIAVSNLRLQSMFGVWMYCCRNRTARTLNTLRMAAKLGGCSLNKLWIGPAMKSKPGIIGWGIVRVSLERTATMHWTRARWANGLRVRRCYKNQLVEQVKNYDRAVSAETMDKPSLLLHIATALPDRCADDLEDECREPCVAVGTIQLKVHCIQEMRVQFLRTQSG